jgi:hypothetical protein
VKKKSLDQVHGVCLERKIRKQLITVLAKTLAHYIDNEKRRCLKRVQTLLRHLLYKKDVLKDTVDWSGNQHPSLTHPIKSKIFY